MIKIQALEASSCLTIRVLLLHLGSQSCPLPGTLEEFTPQTGLKRLKLDFFSFSF